MLERMRRRADFLRAQHSGKRYRGRQMVLMVTGGVGARSLVGLTVSRRVGNAVVRNRVRRRLREILRGSSCELRPGDDYVVVAFPGAAIASFRELREELIWLLRKAKGSDSHSASSLRSSGSIA
ncbi:MAG: ribonuclease P protein component [Myxococcota bacterium]